MDSLQGWCSTGYLPNNKTLDIDCLHDSKSYYDGNDVSKRALPSPYLSNGARNPLYYSSEISATNACADFNGVKNTEDLLKSATSQPD
jgi:hypothetical protein